MAVLCNTTDSHITGSNPAFPLSNQPITFTCWMSGVWSSPESIKSFVGIYGPNTTAPTTAIQIGSRTTAGSCHFWSFGGVFIISTPAIMIDNQLYFITYTCDGTTAMAYIDGVLQATQAVALPLAQYTNFYINGFPTGNTLETSTHIVESVRLYNRVLSASEILTMYNSRGTRHCIVDGLVAHYEFDEGTAGTDTATCVDWAGNIPLSWVGAGTPMTYTYTNAESKLRPVL